MVCCNSILAYRSGYSNAGKSSGHPNIHWATLLYCIESTRIKTNHRNNHVVIEPHTGIVTACKHVCSFLILPCCRFWLRDCDYVQYIDWNYLIVPQQSEITELNTSAHKNKIKRLYGQDRTGDHLHF